MMMCGFWLMSGYGRRGQHDGEGGAGARTLAVGGDGAAMHVDDALDDRKPEAGRAFAGGRLGRKPLETTEQPAEVLGRQPGALVADADHGVAGVVIDHERNPAADRAVFDGVRD